MPDLDGAGLDAPNLGGADDQLEDQQLDDLSEGDGSQGEGDGGEGNGDGADGQGAGDVAGDERKLPQWIKDLKPVNNAAFKQAKAVFFGKLSMDDKLKDFDLDGTKAFLEEHGGRESLQGALAEMQAAKLELDGLVQAAANGDRALIDRLAESPEGFAKLAPAMAERWAQQDPEGWDHAMSGVFNATIQQSGVPMHLERMELNLEQMRFALESNPQLTQSNPALAASYNNLVKMLGTLKGWTGSFAEKAGKALTRQQALPGGQQQQNGKGTVDPVEQGKQELFQERLGDEVTKFRDPLITSELKTFAARRPNDADAQQLAVETVRAKVIERMAGDADFQKKLNALCARRDKEGAMRLIKSRETTAIQEIAPKVGRSIFGNPAAKGQGDGKQGQQQQRQQQQQRRQAPVVDADVDPRDAVLKRAFAR